MIGGVFCSRHHLCTWFLPSSPQISLLYFLKLWLTGNFNKFYLIGNMTFALSLSIFVRHCLKSKLALLYRLLTTKLAKSCCTQKWARIKLLFCEFFFPFGLDTQSWTLEERLSWVAVIPLTTLETSTMSILAEKATGTLILRGRFCAMPDL